MTRIRFNVKARKSWPLKNREIIKKAAFWGSKQLEIHKLPISILVRFMGRSEDHGGCIKLKPNKYVIHIHSDRSIRRSISTIFHELTHIKQCVEDGFELIEGGAFWKRNFVVVRNDEYWNLPWEIEARRSERELRRVFFKLPKNNS